MALWSSWSSWGLLPVLMLKLTQGPAGPRSSFLSAEQQSNFHAVTRVLQHGALNTSVETEEFLSGQQIVCCCTHTDMPLSLWTSLLLSFQTHIKLIYLQQRLHVLSSNLQSDVLLQLFLFFCEPHGKTLVHRGAHDACTSCLVPGADMHCAARIAWPSGPCCAAHIPCHGVPPGG